MNLNRQSRQQRGLSLVELMVGVSIGLLIVAGAGLVVGTQLAENRRLLLETQVQQDLRSAADIIARELRRSGSWQEARKGIWFRGTTGVLKNPFEAVTPTGSAVATETEYRYHRSAGIEGPFRFKLEGNTIKAELGTNGLQELTDSRTLKITAFSIAPVTTPATAPKIPCPKLCADGTQNCWPSINVRELVVVIEGEAASDAAVKRRVQSTVRLRNDWVRFNDVLNPTQLCPV